MPAGWYADAQVEGGLRYWDGRAWTNSRTRDAGALPPPPPVGSMRRSVPPPPPGGHAPAPRVDVSPWGGGAGGAAGEPAAAGGPAAAAATRGGGPRRRVPVSTWVVGGAVVVLLLVALVGGVGAFLVVLGLVALLTGVYVTVSRRRSWAMLPASRPIGAGVIVAALIVTGVGGGVASAEHPRGSSSVAAGVASPTDAATSAATAATDAAGAGAGVGGDATPTPDPGASGAADGGQADPETATAPPEGSSVVAADTRATTGTALAVLETLAVKGRAPKTGYDRTGQFGTAWLDVDRNGCDTRNDILARDLTDVTKSGPCKVLTGVLADRYTGTTIDFVRGNTTSTLVQIDHVVALSDAWQKGAQQLTEAQRISLANDPLNLWATDGATNEAKGDGDAATWLPPAKGFRCEYAARQVSVKATYGLWVTQAEHDALAGILAACPEQPAVSSTFTPAQVAPAEPADPVAPAAPAPAPVAPAVPAAPAAPAPASVTYPNCAAARAAGAAPILRGDPGYSSRLDGDDDGIACE